jgi:hypothetical protein
MSNRKKTGKLAPFIAMDRNQFKSAAFAQLSAVAQALLVHLTSNYNSNRMNEVWMSARDGAKKLNICKSAAAYALLELEHYGFIVQVRGSYLGVAGVGQSAHYRLTAQRYGEVGATRDYEKWNGEIFSPKKRGKPERKSRTKPWVAEGLSRRTWYRRQAGTVAQNPVRPEGQRVRPEGHSSLIQNPPKNEKASAQRDIESHETSPPGGTYLVSPARSAAEVCQDSRQPEPAQPAVLMEWTTPVLTETEYTPELRRLYREAVSSGSVVEIPEDWTTPLLVKTSKEMQP